jgi:hypothetical protein
MYDDFNITRNPDGSDFTINQDDDKKGKQEPKKPKPQKPGNSSSKKGSQQKTLNPRH